MSVRRCETVTSCQAGKSSAGLPRVSNVFVIDSNHAGTVKIGC